MKSNGVRKGFAALAGLGILTGLMTLSQPAQARDGGVFWRGNVDNVTRIIIRDGAVRSFAVSGKSPYSVSARTVGGQPDSRDRVSLDGTWGRGEIRILQHPDRRNDFTTIVEIRDPQGGSSPYEFRLNWRSSGGGWGDDRPGWGTTGTTDRDMETVGQGDNRPDYGRPGDNRPGDNRPGWGNGRPDRDDDRWTAAEREAYRLGYAQGRRDNGDRKRSDYARYRGQFNSRTEAEFRRGYLEGYRSRNRP